MTKSLKAVLYIACALWGGLAAQPSLAAEGELGTGVPVFGMYSAATGVNARVWNLTDATVPFPSGCTFLILTPTTMGQDSYKAALAAMLLAQVTYRRVRFYSHAPRDGGCGVDYVQLL